MWVVWCGVGWGWLVVGGWLLCGFTDQSLVGLVDGSMVVWPDAWLGFWCGGRAGAHLVVVSGSSLGHPGIMMGHLKTMLGSSCWHLWAILGSCWVHLGISWGHVGIIFGQLWRHLGFTTGLFGICSCEYLLDRCGIVLRSFCIGGDGICSALGVVVVIYRVAHNSSTGHIIHDGRARWASSAPDVRCSLTARQASEAP